MTSPLVTVKGLKTHFIVRHGLLGHKRIVRAVDGVDLAIPRGKTVGLVGESGSGKTTVGRTILSLIPATAGQVLFDDTDVLPLKGEPLRALRQRMQVIFQDPVGSLDPRMSVGRIIAEPLVVHTRMTAAQRRSRVGELLEMVGLSRRYVNRYPHEFSGGQRQRIGIARALATEPDFIVCDEPVSALDVSIQAQILNLLRQLQKDLGLTYLFIAHNLAVVEHFADEVAVMYLGRIVEHAERTSLYRRATHPYTQSLLAAVPVPDPSARKQHVPLPGEMPSPAAPPSGCPFHPRCPLTRQIASTLSPNDTVTIRSAGQPVRVVARCVKEVPTLMPLPNEPTHLHACLLAEHA